ncbi:MAG: hypothetical protein ACI8XM_000955 [Haloarculaceae archaeon]|jgi:hypothetical protein
MGASRLLIHDAVRQQREMSFVLGTADTVTVEPTDGELVRVRLPPLDFQVPGDELREELEELLATVFREKSARSDDKTRSQGLALATEWVSSHGGSLDAERVHQELVSE